MNDFGFFNYTFCYITSKENNVYQGSYVSNATVYWNFGKLLIVYTYKQDFLPLNKVCRFSECLTLVPY